MNLVKVDGDKKVATFENIDTGESHEEEFDMIHVSPPMSAPDFIKSSPLANEQGWVDVDKNTTLHNRFPNVFSLGDASGMPNSKTGAAIREQAPVLVDHLVASVRNSQSNSSYDGYASCPLVTSRSTCILAEFNYEGKPTESFPFNQAKERYSMYWMKKNGIPFMYWTAMMNGFFSPRDFFSENIGQFERIMRVVVGLILVSLAFIGPKNPWFLLGVVPLLTGMLGWCPPYQLLGISTCRVKSNKV